MPVPPPDIRLPMGLEPLGRAVEVDIGRYVPPNYASIGQISSIFADKRVRIALTRASSAMYLSVDEALLVARAIHAAAVGALDAN